MEQNLSVHDLKSTISETSYDSDSTASNSIIEEYMCNQLDGSNKQQPSNVNIIAISSSSNIQIGNRVVYNGPVTINRENSTLGSEFKNVNIKLSSESPAKEVKNIHKRDTKWKIFTVISLTLIMSVFLLIWMFNLKYTPKNISIVSTTTSQPYEFKLYSRSDWNASEPDGRVDPFILPLNRVIINHTVMKNCYTKNCCIQNMKQMESLHMKKKFHHIGYNFVICNDGNAYEGIGWDSEGVHTFRQNPTSLGIAFNGDFRHELPNRNQITAFFTLLKLGVELEKLSPDYKIYGACQFTSSESPGEALFQLIQTWDKWSE